MQNVREFDFVGLILAVGGVVCLLMGFNYAETSWSDKKTIALLVVGVGLFVLCGINEVFLPAPPAPAPAPAHQQQQQPPTPPTTTNDKKKSTTGRQIKNPIFPPRMFKTRTTTGILLSSAIQFFVFTGGSYYLPNYFQVLGSSATNAGIRMIPFSVGGALCAILGGQILARTGRYRPIMWISWAILVLGYGLFYLLDVHTSTAVQVILLLVEAIGLGPLFPVPFIALQAAMPLKDMATATSTLALVRFLGGTIGISVGNTIYQSGLRHRLPKIQGYHPVGGNYGMTNDVRQLIKIEPPEVREQVLHAYTRSIALIWVVYCALAFLGLLL
ncbi:hypothetical protein FS842_007506, partial [Serendipita sp. 407]